MKSGDLFSQMWRMIRLILAEAQPELAAAKLTVRAFFVLCKIEEFPYPAQLAEQLLLPPPTISLHIRELETLGYVKRELDQKDLRRYRLTLTAHGTQTLKEVKAAIDELMEKRCGRASKHEVKELGRILSILEAN